MAIPLGSLEELMSCHQDDEILLVRKGNPNPYHNFFVYGKFHAVDGNWLDISDSIRLPLTSDKGADNPETLVGSAKSQESRLREKSVVSYRLTGFLEPDRNFPSPKYQIYRV